MTSTIYIVLGVIMCGYALTTMVSQPWFRPSFKKHWLHYALILASIVCIWPMWLVVGFVTYVTEILPKNIR